MINYELKATFDNLKESLLEDSVGRNESIADLIKFLDETEGNIAIALNDSWGNGKTFFVKQTQMVLQSYDSSDPELAKVKKCMEKYFKNHQVKHYIPVYYDAWSNDNDDDPILSIIFEMLQDIEDLQQYEVTDKDWWNRITFGIETISTSFGGPRVKKFLDAIKGEDPFKEIKKIKETDQILNDIFDALLEKCPEDTRIIFFIDELDRCCPDFAVRLLERIKHHFLHEKVIFVITINSLELQHTIKRHYGNDFNANQYLHRFFDFSIPLPSADMKKYYSSIHFTNISRWRNDVANSVIQKYKFSLREITRYLQYLKAAVPEKYPSFQSKHPFYMEILIPFLIGLNIHNLKKYNEFINGENAEEFIKIMLDCSPDSYFEMLLVRGHETFEVNSKDNRKILSLADKFQPIYECLFGGDREREISVYGDTICASDRQMILNVISRIRAS